MTEPKQTGGKGKIQPRWKKGVSGNPKGRPAVPKNVKDVLPDLQAIFAKVLSEKKGDMTLLEAGIRRTAQSWINAGNINAGKLLLAYAYGNPKEITEDTMDTNKMEIPTINVHIGDEAIKRATKQ